MDSVAFAFLAILSAIMGVIGLIACVWFLRNQGYRWFKIVLLFPLLVPLVFLGAYASAACALYVLLGISYVIFLLKSS